MKSTELRIGNLVDSKLVGGFALRSENLSDFDNGFIELEPIPLTEEWLLKIGFEKSGGKVDNEGDIRYVIFDEIESTIYVSYGSNFVGNCDSGFCYIEHVHQLQNLYHALTGEELIIKEACTI